MSICLKRFAAGAAFFASRCLARLRLTRFRRPNVDLADARRKFHWEREHVEAKFLELVQVTHKLGTPNWDDCDFADEALFVFNRRPGQLAALVEIRMINPLWRSLSKSLEEDWSDFPAEQLRLIPMFRSTRSATAIFYFDAGHWTTDGNVLFNLSPTEAVRFYRHDLKTIDDEPDSVQLNKS